MDVSVLASAARGGGVGWVRYVEHVEASGTWQLTGGTNGVDHVGLFMGNNVVGATDIRVPRSEVILNGEVLRARRIDFKELDHILSAF